MAELPRKGVRRDARCARGSKDPERRRGGTRASRGRRDGSNRRRMGGKAPLKSLRGLGLLCSTRTHLHEADVLGVLAEALPADVQVVLANDTPLVPTHAAVEEKGGGGSGSQSGSRVNRAKRRNPRNWRGLPRLARRVRAPGRARRRAVVSCMPRMLRLSVDRVARPSRVAPGTSSREAARSTRSRNKHAARRRAGSRGRRPDATRTSDAGPCRYTAAW